MPTASAGPPSTSSIGEGGEAVEDFSAGSGGGQYSGHAFGGAGFAGGFPLHDADGDGTGGGGFRDSRRHGKRRCLGWTVACVRSAGTCGSKVVVAFGWCGREVVVAARGRVPHWCGSGCRHRAWE